MKIRVFSERIRPEPEMIFEYNNGIWTSTAESYCQEYRNRMAEDDTFQDRLSEIEEELKEEISRLAESLPVLPRSVDVVFTTFPITFKFVR